MEIPAEIWIASAYGGIITLAAVGRYLSRPREPRKHDPILAGIGLGFGDERFLAILTRCAEALEALADKRTDEMEDMHKALLERLDAQERREEQEEQRPRRAPPRRR